jgi:cytochrome c peroxidase
MATATASRFFARTALTTTARGAFIAGPARNVFRQSGRRFYSSEAPKQAGGGGSRILLATGVLAGGAGGLYYFTQKDGGVLVAKEFKPTKKDYQAAYNEIASRLEEKDDYDDGSYGPVLLRLAWHASGTYDKETGTGGSDGSTMRFAPESDHGANAGLKAARDFLQPVKGRMHCCPYRVIHVS